MFSGHHQILVLGILAVTLLSCTRNDTAFLRARDQAKQAGLLEVGRADKGVPFYTVKTLDPVWNPDGAAAIVTLPQLSLQDQNGAHRQETMFDGKISLVGFFFTSCSGFCPTFLKNLQTVEKRLKGFPSLQYVAISVDPETDTPARMKKHFIKMGLSPSTWTLLTGDKKAIWSLARDTFAAETFPLPVSKGQIAHSEHFFVIDSSRRLRGVLRGTRLDLADRAEALVKELTQELQRL